MNNQNNIIDVLIAKYLGGTTSEKENAEIEHWLGSRAENKKIFDQMQKVWFKSQGLSVNTELSFDKKKAFENVMAKINEDISGTNNKPKNKIVKLRYYFARVAALFILGVSSYLVYQYFSSNSIDNSDFLTNTKSDQEFLSSDSSFILLPDKSSIYLNTNGIVQYAKNFTENRTVLLEGSGYFEVEKLEGKPFIVVTNDIEIKVLGTSFYIIPQLNDSTIEVGVTTGIVEVKDKSKDIKVQLKLNESVKYNTTTQSFSEILPLDLNALFWKTGELEFNEQPLDEVFVALSEVYQTAILFDKESMTHCIFTGRFSNSSLMEILDLIKVNFNIKISKDSEGNIEILGKGCK